MNARQIVISMSDQIPVWLKPDSGKMLAPRADIEKAQAAKKKRVRRSDAASGAVIQTEEADRQPETCW